LGGEKLRAEIILEFHTHEIAVLVSDAIEPDNTPLPPGMKITVTTHGTNLSIVLESKRGIDSFRGTIEDLMSAIDLSLRTIFSLTSGS
jgi:tRNA threonylcarbamoyladenosine modification (KEOPS) complex  Pcc1 subunit